MDRGPAFKKCRSFFIRKPSAPHTQSTTRLGITTAALNFILVACASGSAYLSINLINPTPRADFAQMGAGGPSTRADGVSRRIGRDQGNQGA
jgi:hypothetical protein